MNSHRTAQRHPLDYAPKGRGFESLQPYQKPPILSRIGWFFVTFLSFLKIGGLKNSTLIQLAFQIQAFFKKISDKISALRWSASSITWA